MDTLLNIKAFLATARSGSFSAAARQLGVAPSVITKRVSRLEDQMRARLFVRSTRSLALTEIGERYLPRYAAIVSELEDAISGVLASGSGLTGQLRIKAPTSLTVQYLAAILSDFRLAHPRITIHLVLVDRSVNPVEEGFDVAIGALPASYANVVDEPLCPYRRVVCATPAYVAARGTPAHPHDLIEHDCLTYHATGGTWSFDSPRGAVNVDVHSSFSANDTQILHDLACRGLGIALVGVHVAQQSLASGRLVALLPDYPVTELWLKALVPKNKIENPNIQALLDWLKRAMQPVPPWERAAG